MTIHARRSRPKGLRAAGGRHRSRPKATPKASTGSSQLEHADQEPPAPQSTLDFLWKVSRDPKAQDGLCRLMRNAVANLILLGLFLLAVPVVLYVTMPGSQPVRAITTACTVLGEFGLHLALAKRRSRRLTAVGPTSPGRLVMTAQEGNGWLASPDCGRREQGSYARPDQDAQTARERGRGPCTSRSRHDSGFHPVRDQRQPAPA